MIPFLLFVIAGYMFAGSLIVIATMNRPDGSSPGVVAAHTALVATAVAVLVIAAVQLS